MKIFFMYKDRPGSHGGPVINAQRVLSGLKERGWDVRAGIVCGAPYAPSRAYLEEWNIPIHVIRAEDRSKEEQVQELLAILAEDPPDVFVPNVCEIGGIAARWLREAGIPSIIAHRSDDDRNWGAAKRFALKDSEWASCHLICVSRYLKEESERIAEKKPSIRVIPSGVPLPDLSSKAFFKGERPLRLIYASRLHQKQKRVKEMLHAMIGLAQKHPGALSFTLMGSGEQRDDLESMVRSAGLEERFHFEDPCYGNAYHRELMAHDVLILLSDYEGTPGSVMDGMACGLVPIVKRVHGIGELISDGVEGRIVEDRDEELFRAVEGFLERPEELEPKARNARQKIEKGFSIDVTLDRWEAFFHELREKSGEQKKIPIPEAPLPMPDLDFFNAREGKEKPGLWQRFKDKTRIRTRMRKLLKG